MRDLFNSSNGGALSLECPRAALFWENLKSVLDKFGLPFCLSLPGILFPFFSTPVSDKFMLFSNLVPRSPTVKRGEDLVKSNFAHAQ